MFARQNAHHHQIAYVTNDLDAAMEVFKKDYAVSGFFVFNNRESGAAHPREPELRIALAHVNGVEIELIEPVGVTAAVFKDVVEPGAGLQIQFHHVALRIEGSLEHWAAHEESIDKARHSVVYAGALGDEMRFFYTDERARLGHYVEHVWMSPNVLAQIAAVRPKFPKD